MIKQGVQVVKKKNLYYIAQDENGSLRHYKPWPGDAFSFAYDYIMKNSIFSGKFGGSIRTHYEIMKKALRGVHGQRILELAAGTGSAANFLANDNQYIGSDISPGLLKRAVRNFKAAGFKAPEFYVARADDLPFSDNAFSVCLCILSLNFFDDIKGVIQEIRRVMAPGSVYFCSVPVPERNSLRSRIRGTLYSEKELEVLFKASDFQFSPLANENGALLYFKASLLK